MLPLVKVKEAERLLAEGKLSQRKIASAVGISRATVSAIASGRRPDYEARQLARAAENELWGPIVRCPECGGMVYSPCRLCRARKAKKLEQETAKAFRRQARELAVRRLLIAVERARHEPEVVLDPNRYLPADWVGGASDCK